MQMAMQRHEHVLTHLSINYFRIFKAPMLLTAIGRKQPKRLTASSDHFRCNYAVMAPRVDGRNGSGASIIAGGGSTDVLIEKP